MQKSRMIWLDCLRLTAGLSMVILHTTADPNGQPWPAYEVQDRVGPIVLRTIAYMARTELFLMIACFLLVLSLRRRPRGYRETMAEQTRRLVLPFVFWTVFYAFYNLIKADYFGYEAAAWSEITDVTAWAGHLLLGDIKYHMHFLPTLFGLLLFYPLFLRAYDKPILGIAVIPLLLIKWELDRQIWSTFWDTEILPFVVRAVKLMTYVGFGMAAAALVALYQRTTPSTLRLYLPHVLFIAVLLSFFKAFASYETLIGAKWQFSYAPAYWADFIMPIILFFACMALSDRSWPNLLSKVGGYSFGIYLCHPIIVDLAEISLHQSALSPTAQVLVKLSAALSLTPILVVAIGRIPLTAWTVGLGPLPKLTKPKATLPQRS